MTKVDSEFRPWEKDVFVTEEFSAPVTRDEFDVPATSKIENRSSMTSKVNTEVLDGKQNMSRVGGCSPRESDGLEKDKLDDRVGSFVSSPRFELIYAESDVTQPSTESQGLKKERGRSRSRKIRDMFRSKTPVRMFRKRRGAKKSNEDKKDVRDEHPNEALNPLHGIVEVREVVQGERNVDRKDVSSKEEVDEVAEMQDEVLAIPGMMLCGYLCT